MNFLNESLESLHQKLVAKEVTATELVDAAYEAIDKLNEDVYAFIHLTKEEAYKRAEEIDAEGVKEGEVLKGIPLGLKDNLSSKGIRTTASSKMLEDFIPIFDATVVEKLQAAGMILIGKLNMDEFAMGGTTETSYFGPTKNPWDLSKVPGGSSGGSAAAVAAGMVPVSLGSDTGGSIRQPASYNGVVGMKPSYGRVSRFGAFTMASAFDTVGPLTRTVKDNALVLQALAGFDPKDPTTADQPVEDYTANIDKGVAGLKLAVPSLLVNPDQVDPGTLAVMEDVIEKYKSLGASVEEVDMPLIEYVTSIYMIIMSAEVSTSLQRYDGIRYGYRSEDADNLDDLYKNSRTEGLGQVAKDRTIMGAYAALGENMDEFYEQAAKVRTALINEAEAVFEDYDLIIAPVDPGTAPDLEAEKRDNFYMADAWAAYANLLGSPSISVPSGFDDGLPVGTQIIGKKFDEALLYQAAYALEEAVDLLDVKPAINGGQA